RCWTWYLLSKTAAAAGPAPGPAVAFASPPSISRLCVPQHLAKHSCGLPLPDPDDDVVRLLAVQACCASQNGLLLFNVQDIRAAAPILARQGAEQGGNHVRRFTGLADPGQLPGMTHYVFNPCNRDFILAGFKLGLLTQADAAGGFGPPDRYAVAEMEAHLGLMLRFLSETGEWEIVQGSPCQLPAGRRLLPNQEAVAWSGRLWWVDLAFGAVCAEPFSDRPEPHFVQLPSGSVLPADMGEKAFREALRRGTHLPDAEGNVSQVEPFVLSSFKLDTDCGGWTLEHRVALSRLWADGGHPWLPLQGGTTPLISALDMAESNVVYISVGKHIVGVDMHKGEVTGDCPAGGGHPVLRCIITPWLATTRIPGKKDVMKKDTLADVLVRSDRCGEMKVPTDASLLTHSYYLSYNHIFSTYISYSL
ncbi:hypothetical protein BRADI_4g13807v3, partial [Brachypodium distachyon]